MRKKFELTDIEFKQFKRLPPFEGVAMNFWRRIAHVRNLDYRTIISSGQSFTALPVGHGKQWCFPLPLKCIKASSYRD